MPLPPNISIKKSSLRGILPIRAFFLRENQIQIRYDACHERNWSTSYTISDRGQIVGYGTVKGKEELADRDAIFEFYLLPIYRKWSAPIFEYLLAFTGVDYVEAQSNEPFLTALLYEYCQDIYADVILFAEDRSTKHVLPGVTFRQYRPGDDVFGKSAKEAGEFVLEKDGIIVATGGFLTHYNLPFADLYMETHPDFRNRGFSSYLLQELKKECYAAGYKPAARCNLKNKASQNTLLKAGFRICGFMLTGRL